MASLHFAKGWRSLSREGVGRTAFANGSQGPGNKHQRPVPASRTLAGVGIPALRLLCAQAWPYRQGHFPRYCQYLVPGTMLRAVRRLSSGVPTASGWVFYYIPSLHVKKLRTRDIKLLAQGCAAGRDRSHRGQAVMLVINRGDCSSYEEVSDENVSE